MAAAMEEETISETTFEQTWSIKDFQSVIQNKARVDNTKTEIDCKVDNLELAKFSFFTKMDGDWVGLYWQLTYKHDSLDDVEAQLVTTFQKSDDKFEKEVIALLENPMEITGRFWFIKNPTYCRRYINEVGSLEINLKLTIKNIFDLIYNHKNEQFQRASQSELSQDLIYLLGDKDQSDVTIVTKDKIELGVHRTILRARCPIFAAMFRSDFRENRIGIVNVNDVSAKTMKIILQYWYTSELLPSWKDNDIIFEFTYAAGKYQMTSILKQLDELVCCDSKTEYSDDELLQLLKIVSQLSLKKAEARILKLILIKVNRAADGAGLLGLFSFGTDNLENQSFDILQVINSFEGTFSGVNEKASSLDVKMMALSCKFGQKTLETKLVQRIKGTVAKITCADELFALFNT